MLRGRNLKANRLVDSFFKFGRAYSQSKIHLKRENAKGYLAEQDEIESKAHFKKI